MDIQKDRIEVEIVAWGEGKSHGRLIIRYSKAKPLKALSGRNSRLCSDTHYPTESGAALPIVKFAIDSGYAPPEVYAWTRGRGDARAVVIKGDSRAATPVSQPTLIDVGPHGKRVRAGIKIWPVNGSMIKEELYRWLHLDRPTESANPYPPGCCHFPKYGEEYFKQITAEQLVTRIVKGYRSTEWQKTRDRNEGLDCRIY